MIQNSTNLVVFHKLLKFVLQIPSLITLEMEFYLAFDILFRNKGKICPGLAPRAGQIQFPFSYVLTTFFITTSLGNPNWNNVQMKWKHQHWLCHHLELCGESISKIKLNFNAFVGRVFKSASKTFALTKHTHKYICLYIINKRLSEINILYIFWSWAYDVKYD